MLTATLLASVLMGGTPIQDAAGLGRIDFPSSGAPEAKAPFVRGVLLLHSFEYDDAAEAFREAQAADPGFALAYWGEALTHCHPIWNEDDPEAAREVLARLAPTRGERLAKAPEGRERGLLAAVEALYGEGGRLERNRAYSRAMAELHERFPDDLEIASFYALSILGTSGRARDLPVYMRAAAVAEEVYRVAPRHPGALHYLIHAYDDPIHAPLGLRMARVYAEVAPDAEHALHMPSHIWVALGRWEDSAAANEASSAAADKRRERKGLPVDERGFHALWWLHYTYLQQGRVDEARKLLDDMVRDTGESGSKRTRFHLVAMRAAHVVNAQAWDGPEVEIEVDLEDLGLNVAVADLFVRGLAAVRRGEAETARNLLERIAARRAEGIRDDEPPLAGCCLPAPGYEEMATLDPREQAALVMELELRGLLALEEGAIEQGLELLREACRTEDADPLDFGPPRVVKPAHELLGEELGRLGRNEEAQEEFERALARAPGRRLSKLGMMRVFLADQAARLGQEGGPDDAIRIREAGGGD